MSSENTWSSAHLQLAILIKIHSNGEILKFCILIADRNHCSESLFWIKANVFKNVCLSVSVSEWCSEISIDHLWMVVYAIWTSNFWWKC